MCWLHLYACELCYHVRLQTLHISQDLAETEMGQYINEIHQKIPRKRGRPRKHHLHPILVGKDNLIFLCMKNFCHLC